MEKKYYATVKISGNQISVQDLLPMTAGTVGAYIKVCFGEDWKGLSKTLVWRAGEITVADINCSGAVPSEILESAGNRIFVGVYGNDEEGALPTHWADLGYVNPGANPNADPATEPSLPVWVQINELSKRTFEAMEKIQDRANNGEFNGTAGVSATHRWDGTVLTVTSASGTSSADLKGQQGEPGAVNIEDSSVAVDSAWSSKNTVDKLCPGFTESGCVVTCAPVEGYPLGVVSKITPVQSGSGDPSPDNVRPITGHTSAKLWRGGKNLYNIDLQIDNPSGGLVNNGDGSITVTASYTSNGILGYRTLRQLCPGIKAGASYVLSAKTSVTSSQNQRIYLLNTKTSWTFGTSVVLTDEMLDSDVYWYADDLGGTCTISNIQIESGSVATAYEPYRDAEEFTLDFGQTVYGGSFDWAKGELTVTHGIYTLDGTQKLAKHTDGIRYYPVGGIGDMAYVKLAEGFCDRLPVAVTGYETGPMLSIGSINNYPYLHNMEQLDSRLTDAAAVESWLSENPVSFTYPLMEPITIQLAPQEIFALSGTNTLYSTTGDTAVSGKADPAAVIDSQEKRIAALEASLIALLEG